MRKTGRCILSAVIAVLLMIGAIDYAFVIGKAKHWAIKDKPK